MAGALEPQPNEKGVGLARALGRGWGVGCGKRGWGQSGEGGVEFRDNKLCGQ